MTAEKHDAEAGVEEGPPHPVSQVIAVLVLVAVSMVGGMVCALWCDIFRLGILDPERASSIGYTGEITSAIEPIHPRGISSGGQAAMFLVALLGTFIAWPVVLLQRRRMGDDIPGLLPTAVLLCAMLPGFLWIAPAWAEPTPRDWSAFDQLLLTMDVWVPALIGLLGFAALTLWLRAPGTATSRRDPEQRHTPGRARGSTSTE